MDNKIIRAYLWQEVIRLAFSPSGREKQKEWVEFYGNTLDLFLETGSFHFRRNIKKKSNTEKVIYSYTSEINLQIEWVIEAINKFTVKFQYLPPSNNRELMWTHDVDGAYFTFPIQEFLTHHNQRKSVLRAFSDEDIETVLDALIFHPAAHQHIKSPIDKHYIRIGGGTDNPYLFLFHLRYQFCPNEEARQSEKNRLIKLFSDAVREGSSIPVSRLMGKR